MYEPVPSPLGVGSCMSRLPLGGLGALVHRMEGPTMAEKSTKKRKPPATHCIQGVKAGGVWRILVISVGTKTVGAAEGSDLKTVITNALVRCGDLEKQRRKEPKATRDNTLWVVQNDLETLFMHLGGVYDAKATKA